MIPFIKGPSIHHFSAGCDTNSDRQRDVGAGALEAWGQPLIQIVRCVILVSGSLPSPHIFCTLNTREVVAPKAYSRGLCNVRL